MDQKIYGYVRVSSREQNEDRQVLALKELQIPKAMIYMDKQSGKDFNRPHYHKLVKKLKEGDLFLLKALTGWGEIMKKFYSNGGC